jgi:type IV secretory pathway VirD2 relaxase
MGGVTREGLPGSAYDAPSDRTDLEAFLERSDGEPHQFRFIVSPEDSARLRDL